MAKDREPLTEAQRKAAYMLYWEERINDIAAACGVHRTTIWRWKKLKGFHREYMRIDRNYKRRMRYRWDKEKREKEKRIAEAEAFLRKEQAEIHGKPRKSYWKAVEAVEKAQFDGFTVSQILDFAFTDKLPEKKRRRS